MMCTTAIISNASYVYAPCHHRLPRHQDHAASSQLLSWTPMEDIMERLSLGAACKEPGWHKRGEACRAILKHKKF
uniref:Uncharacterized protein n=1 Tax=Arundo donax TaxID=35708 RepID=A0A0A8XWR8_ARUDO